MSISIIGHTAAVTASSALSISVTMPSGAASGDAVLVVAASERAEVPTVTIGGSSTGIVNDRSTSTTNLSVLYAWKRLGSTDVGATITATNTANRIHALAVLVVRGTNDPTFTDGAFIAAANSVYTATGPSVTPSADSALLAGLWAFDYPVSPYSGYTWTSTWTEQVEADGTYTTAINPTAFITTKQLGTGTSGAAVAGEVVTNTGQKFEAIPSVAILTPAVTTPPSPPTAKVTGTVGQAVIDATGSTTTNGGTLSYAISPAGPVQLAPGIWRVTQGNTAATYTVTVTETSSAGTASKQVTYTVAAANPTLYSKVRSGGKWI